MGFELRTYFVLKCDQCGDEFQTDYSSSKGLITNHASALGWKNFLDSKGWFCPACVALRAFGSSNDTSEGLKRA